MITKEEIKGYIESGLTSEFVDVSGDDGQHFEAVIVSAEFAGKSRVQRHQLVYKALGSKMGNEIHALSFKTLTPEEWREQAGA